MTNLSSPSTLPIIKIIQQHISSPFRNNKDMLGFAKRAKSLFDSWLEVYLSETHPNDTVELFLCFDIDIFLSIFIFLDNKS